MISMNVHDVTVEQWEKLSLLFETKTYQGAAWISLELGGVSVTVFQPDELEVAA